MEIETDLELVTCPNCGEKGPKTKFCLVCGSPKSYESKEPFQEEHSEPFRFKDVEPVKEDPLQKLPIIEEPIIEEPIAEEPIRDEPITRSLNKGSVLDGRHEPDSQVKENMLNLIKSIDLIVWLIDIYLEGDADEEHFNQYCKTYEYRLDQCLKHRSQMLESARDLKPIQKALNEAKLNLFEIKKKKKIGDISDEEYKLKRPVYEWDINKYEEEIGRRKSEILVLEDIGQVMSEEEIENLKKVLDESQNSTDEQLKSGKIDTESANKIKEVLKKISDIFQKTENNYSDS